MKAVRIAEMSDLKHIMAFDSLSGDRVAEIAERRMLLVEIESLPKGYISWQRRGCIGEDYNNKLIVDPGSQRRGLARLLIQSLGSFLVGRVFISSPQSNLAALAMLEATDWIRAGNIVGLLPGDEAMLFFRRDF